MAHTEMSTQAGDATNDWSTVQERVAFYQGKLSGLDERLAATKKGSAESETSVPPKQATDWFTQDAMVVGSAVLSFGLCMCLIAAYLVKIGRPVESILRLLGTLLIIVSAVLLIVVGYSERQIAPVIGLLGTIAGYLLGKDSGRDASSSRTPIDGPEKPSRG